MNFGQSLKNMLSDSLGWKKLFIPPPKKNPLIFTDFVAREKCSYIFVRSLIPSRKLKK